MNAITNKNKVDMTECVLYSTHYPCNACARLIIQSSLKHVKYLRKLTGVETEAAEFLFTMTNVKTTDYS